MDIWTVIFAGDTPERTAAVRHVMESPPEEGFRGSAVENFGPYLCVRKSVKSREMEVTERMSKPSDKLRVRSVTCPNCSHSFTAFSETPTCPQCGNSFTFPKPKGGVTW